MPSTVGIFSASGSLKNTAEPAALGYRVNLVRNPSFEVDTTDWSSKGGSSIETSTTQTYVGTNSLKITLGSTATTGALYGPNGNRIPGTPANYTVSCYLRPDSGVTDATYRVRMFTYGDDPNGSLLSSPGGGDTLITSAQSGVWTRLSNTFDLTALSAMNYFSVAVERLSGGAGEIIYVDAFLVERSTTLGTYFDGSSATGFWTGTPHNSFSGGDPYS